MISTDMMQPHLYLTNIDTDKRIRIDLSRDASVAGGTATAHNHHPGRPKAYLSVMNTDDKPLTILALRIGNIDWRQRHRGISENHEGYSREIQVSKPPCLFRRRPIQINR